MTKINIKKYQDAFEVELFLLETHAEIYGATIDLIDTYTALVPDVIGVVYYSMGTKFEKRGRKLNARAAEIRRRIVTGLSTKSLLSQAKSGNSEASWLLVEKFDEKLGVSDTWIKNNRKNYFDWAEAGIVGCAEKGLSYRKWHLASEYMDVENYERAKELLIEAAGEGEHYAAYLLGQLYSWDEGGSDGEKARTYYEQAVADNFAPAMVELANLYFSGDLIEEDERKAFLLLNRATKLGDDDAKEFLSNCYTYGWGTRQNYPKAFQLKSELGPNHSLTNKMALALAYLFGRGVRKDVKKAFQLLKQASNDGHGPASEFLAEEYRFGTLVKESPKTFFKYLEKAQASGNETSKCHLLLGIAYLEGYGCKQNNQLAEFWLRTTYEQSDVESHRMDALFYLEEEMKLSIET
jgi:TPR repeat protein